MPLKGAKDEGASEVPRANEAVFTIGEAAGKLDLHEQTLRNWERAGVIHFQRLGGNRARIFSESDIDRCRWIKKYAGRGISLKGLKTLLKMNGNKGGNGQ